VPTFSADRHQPPLLAERPVTDDERAAVADDPRSGIWAGEPNADRRVLTQDQTDTLIRAELFAHLRVGDVAAWKELVGFVGEPRVVELKVGGPQLAVICHAQRGGIDSEPLVRLLAFRAWGDRDRWWFWGGRKHRVPTDPYDIVRLLYGFDRMTIARDDERRSYLVSVERGAERATRTVSDAEAMADEDPRAIVSCVLDELARVLGVVAPSTRDVAAIRDLARLAFGR